MSADEIHVGDIGTVLRATVKDGSNAVDISGATTKQIILRRPDGTTLEKNADFTSDGTDGRMEYSTVSGDLNQAGSWMLQGYVVLPVGSWKSDTKIFRVYENL